MARLVNSVPAPAAPAANPSVLDLSALLGGSRLNVVESQPSSKRVKDLIEEFEEKANTRQPPRTIRASHSILGVNLSRNPDLDPRSLTITFDSATDLCFTARSVNNDTYNFEASALNSNGQNTARFRILIEPIVEDQNANQEVLMPLDPDKTEENLAADRSASVCASIDRVLGPLRSHLSSCSGDPEEMDDIVDDEPPLFASRQLAEMVGVPQRQGESVLETLVRSHHLGISGDSPTYQEDEEDSASSSNEEEGVDRTFTPSRNPPASEHHHQEDDEEPLLMVPPPSDTPMVMRTRDVGIDTSPRLTRLTLTPTEYDKEEVITESPSSTNHAFPPTDWTPQSHLRRTVSSSWPPGTGNGDGQQRETKSVASESEDLEEAEVQAPPSSPPADFFRYSQRMVSSAATPTPVEAPKMTRARKRREQRKRRREKLRSELGSLMNTGAPPESGFTSQLSVGTPLPSQRKKFMVNGNISGYVHDRGAVIVANFDPRHHHQDWSRDTARAEKVFNRIKRMVPPSRNPVQQYHHGHPHGQQHYYVPRTPPPRTPPSNQRFAMSLTSALVEEAIKLR